MAWFLSGAKCRFAYSPADATATLSLVPVNSDSFYFLGFTFLVLAHSGIVLAKGPLNGCSSTVVVSFSVCICFSCVVVMVQDPLSIAVQNANADIVTL